MLTQVLYKLRGIDKWPTTKATVVSAKVANGYRGNWNSILFTYEPNQGRLQRGKLVADDQTSLFGIEVSDTFDVQYDPDNPSRIYCEDAIPASRDLGIAIIGIVSFFILYEIVIAVLRNFKH